MRGQGKTTREYAKALVHGGWNILYVCIPNSAHVGVVPIMTSRGVSKQRYPDIAAVKGDTVMLVEVEMTLTNSVAADIALRVSEMRESLSNPDIYRAWSAKVAIVARVPMPRKPTIEARLLLVNGGIDQNAGLVNGLNKNQIDVVSANPPTS